MSIRFPKFKMNYAVSGESVSTLGKDIREARMCYEKGAYKATMLLCGSVLENAFLDYLSIDHWLSEQAYSHTIGRNPPSTLDDWVLYEMLRVSRGLQLITDETFQLCDLLRDYRNLIHPAVARRTSINPNRARGTRSLEALKQALNDLDSSFISTWQNAYIINVAPIPACFVSNPNNVQAAAVNILQQHGFHVNIISTFAQLNALLQNPPRFSIIVNSHGEIMPVPPGSNWRNYYSNIGNAVINSGWMFVSIGGYPFYYEAANQPVNDEGLNAFLLPSGMRANCMNATNADFTEHGRSVISGVNMRGLPHALPAARCAIWEGTSQKIVFLGTRNLCGASAIRMGRGWFVHVGLESSFGNPALPPIQLAYNDGVLTNFGIGSALYVTGIL